MLSVGIAPPTVFPGSRLVAAPEWYLSMTVESLKSRRWENWVHRHIGDRAIGSLTFKAVEWAASVAGKGENRPLLRARYRGEEEVRAYPHSEKPDAPDPLEQPGATKKVL